MAARMTPLGLEGGYEWASANYYSGKNERGLRSRLLNVVRIQSSRVLCEDE